MSLLSKSDSSLWDHIKNATVVRYTSKTTQNELLGYMYYGFLEDLIKDLNESNYVSVEADETTDVACKSQFARVQRYVKGTKPVERFMKCIHLTDKTGYS